MNDFLLDRSGLRPLAFTGQELSTVEVVANSGPCSSRWWSIRAFKTDSDKYILALEWKTQWQGENNQDYAEVFESLDDLAYRLENWNPLVNLIGFPASTDGKYAAKQQHIEKTIQQVWAEQVSETLRTLGVSQSV